MFLERKKESMNPRVVAIETFPQKKTVWNFQAVFIPKKNQPSWF